MDLSVRDLPWDIALSPEPSILNLKLKLQTLNSKIKWDSFLDVLFLGVCSEPSTSRNNDVRNLAGMGWLGLEFRVSGWPRGQTDATPLPQLF